MDPATKKTTRPTVIELFAGAGGLSLGLGRAGFDVRYACDIDPWAVQTYNRNVAPHAEVADVREMDGRSLLQTLGLSGVDVLSGGPPCQGFSKQKRGAHLALDERNSLVREYVRLVKEINPRSFVFENVKIFGQKRGLELIDHIEEEMTAYNVHRFFVNSSDFGLAQKRDRFIMIGVRKDVSSAKPVLVKSRKMVTVRDAIGDLPPPPADFTEHPTIANHIQCKITALNLERFKHVPQGGGWPDIPAQLRLECHNGVDVTKGGWPDVYGRLEWTGQCPTITAGFDSFTRGRYGHPEQHRSLTLREGARLQGFPDEFRFYGTRYDVRVQIGNAVPPPLGRAVGLALKKVLDAADAAKAAVKTKDVVGVKARSRVRQPVLLAAE
jgi:DNA (cytosine-5)-methyltransferase 1